MIFWMMWRGFGDFQRANYDLDVLTTCLFMDIELCDMILRSNGLRGDSK